MVGPEETGKSETGRRGRTATVEEGEGGEEVQGRVPGGENRSDKDAECGEDVETEENVPEKQEVGRDGAGQREKVSTEEEVSEIETVCGDSPEKLEKVEARITSGRCHPKLVQDGCRQEELPEN